MHDEQANKKKAKILEQNVIRIIIPRCCREGLDTCEHVPKRQKKQKQNIAL